jgi:hypothetical protein
MSEPKGRAPETSEWPLGTVTVLGAHILDVLGRPVETIPPGADGCLVAWPDSGTQPAVAGRIKEHIS